MPKRRNRKAAGEPDHFLEVAHVNRHSIASTGVTNDLPEFSSQVIPLDCRRIGLTLHRSVAAQNYNAPCTIATTTSLKPRVIGLIAQGDTAWKAGIRANNTYSGSGVTKGGLPQNNIIPILTHYAVGTFSEIGLYFFWSQIDSGPGTSPRYHYDVIDAALKHLCNYNNYFGDNVRAKIHVYHTSNAADTTSVPVGSSDEAQPLYAIGIDTTTNLPPEQWPGTSTKYNYMTVFYDGDPNSPLPIGAFWTPDYFSDWAALQTQMGHRYDGNSLVAETLNGSCASVDEETYLTPADTYTDKNNNVIAYPIASGPEMFSTSDQIYPYSNADKQACLSAAAEAYRAAWPKTYVVQNYASFGQKDPNTYANSSSSTITETLIANNASTTSPANQNPYCITPAVPGYSACFPASQGFYPNLVMEQTALNTSLKTTGWVSYFKTYGGRNPYGTANSIGIAFQPDVASETYADHCASVVYGLQNFNLTEYELNQNIFYGSAPFSIAQMNEMKGYVINPSSIPALPANQCVASGTLP